MSNERRVGLLTVFSRNATDCAVRSALCPMGLTAAMGLAAIVPRVW